MLFSVGVEYPSHDGEALGLVVPALCIDDYACFSAADSEEQVKSMATEAIALVVEEMVSNGVSVGNIRDMGPRHYRQLEDYNHCDGWLLLDVDLSEFMGKPKRINVSLPDGLIQLIDNRVKYSQGQYRDRSHFLAVASRHELEGAQ
ncbi:type II toxin-antitoxin system HicB family antitoxin [Oceanimonas baumannii]|uniref:CopG family transcriptional regulator n=1 Tax=Oceanimonas baumannii TaxID=129578 RepID=A0A235CJS8_9GAMM|nr:type II toxin-antitoxin system HicB family antitoxin [Oceanimonas baumannii]OYD24706.1 CopG family transcriptional regulator [Oceanimonas baumannii]TDW59451.1 HicB-like antitoxin of HicAB toxin-antitoxin system [Oceanimonas baumannii]